jgi:hypothetical protein
LNRQDVTGLVGVRRSCLADNQRKPIARYIDARDRKIFRPRNFDEAAKITFFEELVSRFARHGKSQKGRQATRLIASL